MFERVLVAIDGSSAADRALEVAVRIARAFGSDLTVLTVVPLHINYVPGPMPISPISQDEVRSYRKMLDDRVRKIDTLGMRNVSTTVLEGLVADTILSFLEKQPHDLLVVGARGLSSVGRFILGSVSDALAHHATCPILIFRSQTASSSAEVS